MTKLADEIQHERELREQWQQAHEYYHKIEEKALLLARTDIDRRLEDMNQFRAQIANERGEFMRREMYDQQHGELRDTMFSRMSAINDAMDTRLKLLENTKSNMEGRLWMIGAGISALVIGLELILRYLVR